VLQSHDRLASLAEAHVVGKNGALAAKQKRHAFHLVREETLGKLYRLSERDLGIVGCREDLREGRRVRL
jgi:hypothetical protein